MFRFNVLAFGGSKYFTFLEIKKTKQKQPFILVHVENQHSNGFIAGAFLNQPTSLEILLQASAASIQLLFGQGEGPFTGKLWEVEVGKLPL